MIVITENNFLIQIGVFRIYKCSKCDNREVKVNHKYCSKCGEELFFNIS